MWAGSTWTDAGPVAGYVNIVMNIRLWGDYLSLQYNIFYNILVLGIVTWLALQ
jgi:hypothetical protein